MSQPLAKDIIRDIVEEARRDRKATIERIRKLRLDSDPTRAIAVLTALLKAPLGGDMRITAVETLGTLPSEVTLEALIDIARRDRDNHVRSAALNVLASKPSSKAIKAIQEALKDRAYGVREDAKAILEKLGNSQMTSEVRRGSKGR